MFNDYSSVRDWLESFIPLVYGKEELGLARIENLLKLLGNPERKFKSIHIAGTSGKGSTAFYIAKMLQFSGPVDNWLLGKGEEASMVIRLGRESRSDKPSNLTPKPNRHPNHNPITKVGLHISPHLVDVRERMQINGKLVPMGKFIRLMNRIRPMVESMESSTVGLPSYFEILVAASFDYFAQEKVDWAVIEVGLGGRLDATNVLMPKISVITNIGLDHTEILGKTIEKIAAEKAGIIKPGVPVVTGASGKALGVIEKAARVKGSKLVKVSTQKGPMGNQILAKTALETLKINVTSDTLKKAFRESFGGRFEEIDEGVILDGAHNPDKTKALIRWIKEKNILRAKREVSTKNILGNEVSSHSVRTIILVLAFKKGKKWKKMVDLLVKNLPIEQVIATEFNAVTDTGQFAAVPAEEIAGYVSSIKYSVSSIKIIKNSQQAVFEAIQNTKYQIPDTIVLVTGSLYLVGEVRTMWQLPQF